MIQNHLIKPYCGAISSELESLHPILQRVYAARQIQSLEELDYRLHRLLHFKGLKNIHKAVNLLAQAIFDEKRILIVGDFDTDGATSTTLAISALRDFGANYVDYLVPNRFKYGYGLSPEIVSIANHPDLIMTVDNGISSHAGVIAAQKAGIQVIITDHHLPPEDLPLADAIVNPQQPEDTFLSKNLAGVGVTFYVMLALRDFLQKANWFQQKEIPYPKMNHLLDLVALGTVADMVPLDSNNRILVSCGLKRMSAFQARAGIQALAEVAQINLNHCTASHLGFLIAPKLNAAGRLDDMSIGVECLLSDTKEQALVLAEQLNQLNKKRQSIEKTMQKQAFASLNLLDLSNTQASICLFNPAWHQGITGLVAGRIKEHWQKPTVIFAPSNQSGELKGSARSIVGIHIRDVLANIATQHPLMLSRFGGHAAAAGLSLLEKHYHQFKQLFESTVQKALSNLSKPSIQQTDGELTAEELNFQLALLLREGGPWGQGFPEPLFEGHFQIVSQRIVGQRHLSMTVQKEGLKKPLKGILFNVDLSKWPNLRAHSARLLYRLTIDEWEGRRDIKLQIEKLYQVEHQ